MRPTTKNRSTRSISTPLVVGYLSVILLVGCAGDGVGLTDHGDLEGGLGFTAQIQPIFDANCIRCHSPGGIGFTQTGGRDNNGLDLTRGNSHRALVNQPTHWLPNVDPALRVKIGDPEASFLIHKISSGEPKFGNRMPPDGPPFLSDEEIQFVRNWIQRGALND